jgi:hypothetical protein
MTTTKLRVKPRSKKKMSPTRAHVQESIPRLAPSQPTPEPSQEEGIPLDGRDAYGFRLGSDVSVVLEQLMTGGASKREVASRISKLFAGQQTRGGKPKPVSTIMNQVEGQMKARGFRVESNWRLVAPEDGIISPKPVRAKKPTSPKKRAKRRSSEAVALAKAMESLARAEMVAKNTEGLVTLDNADPEMYREPIKPKVHQRAVKPKPQRRIR